MSVRRRVARLRRRTGNAAWRAALGPLAGRAPRLAARSIAGGEGYRVDLHDYIVSMELMTPAHVERYDFDPGLPSWFRRSKAFDDRYVYRLRDTVVSPRSGLAWFEGGPIVAESTTGGTARLLGWGAEPLEDMLVEPGATIEGPVIVLPEHTFSHWLLEDLPAALHALERAPEATVVVPASPSRRLEGALELLGLSNVHRSDDPVRAEELVLAARDPSYEFMPREDLEIMRRMLVPPAGRGDEEALYISRRRTTRRPANEPELERALEAAGFRAVTPELLPFGEQVQLFAGARHLVSPHGAGLAHVVWSEPGVVSEIFDTGLSHDQFGRLAVALGSVYRPYITERIAPIAEILTSAR